MILAILLSVSSSFVDDLYMELSMDTYPYGVDPSPVVRMRNGASPRIDSLGDESLHGVYKNRNLSWNKDGKCDCNIPEFDLEFNELYYNYGRDK